MGTLTSTPPPEAAGCDLRWKSREMGRGRGRGKEEEVKGGKVQRGALRKVKEDVSGSRSTRAG